MSVDLFFTSYARSDRNHALLKFVRVLRAEIRGLAGLNLHDDQLDLVGFFDTTSIETGDDWQKVLGDGLRTAKVCVCLCSQTYYNREFCGKEYHVFWARRSGWLGLPGNAQREARVIIPVLWRVSGDPPPPGVTALQSPGAGFPPAYTQHGLEPLAQNVGQKASFMKVVKKVAELVWEGVCDVQLPVLPKLDPFDRIPSAFHQPTRYGVVLAASCPEGLAWKPYAHGGSVQFETEAIASQLRARMRTIATGNEQQFQQQVAVAAEHREAVLLFTDPDTARAPATAQRLGELDQKYDNFTVLVIWASPAGQAAADIDAVRAALHAACPNAAAAGRIPDVAAIVAGESLRNALRDSITKLRRELAAADPAMRASDPQVEQAARDQGISPERAPILSAHPAASPP